MTLVAVDHARRVLGPHRLVHRLVGSGDVDGVQQFDLLVADAVGVGTGGGLHEGESQHLHDVVLHDVAERPCRLVEPAPVLDAQTLGHGYLDLFDVPSVPDGLEDGVGEAEGEDVLHRLLAHVVVDPEDLVFFEGGVHLLVEGQRTGQVPSVGLLHHHPHERASLGRSGAGVLGQRPGHQTEHTGDGGQVVEAVAPGPVVTVGLVQVVLQPSEGVRVVVLAGHVLEPVGQRLPFGAALGGGLGHVGPEVVVGPLGTGDADDGEAVVENPPIGQAGQSGQDLAGGEVPGCSEDDHRHRWGLGQHRRQRPPLVLDPGRRSGAVGGSVVGGSVVGGSVVGALGLVGAVGSRGRAHLGVDVSPPWAPEVVVKG